MAAVADFDYLDEHLPPAYGSIEEAKAYQRAARADSYYSCDKCNQQGSVSYSYWRTVVYDCGNRKMHALKKPCYGCGRQNDLGAGVCVGDKCGKGLAPHRCGSCKVDRELVYPCRCGHKTVVETQGNGIGFTHQLPQHLDD